MDSKIRGLAKKAGVSEGKLTDEYLFTLEMIDYFYYNKNIGEQDIRENFVDGTSDGGIDYIFVKDDVMNLIQGKSTDKLTYDDVRNLLYKIAETINNFAKDNYDQYSQKMKSTYLNAIDRISADENINIILFTKTIINDELYAKIDKLKDDEKLRNYNILIYDGEDIENKKINLVEGNDFVKEDILELSDTKNILKYNENGIIVNINANSLKKMYAKYGKKGLFSYNLREHISQKNVDSGIENTIKNERDKFWFYNNGITIGCSDYSIDGNKIRLYNFSIINGAQTTTKIGESKIVSKENDFALVCKIVKAEDNIRNESDFIMKISEASNSQKPIRPRDLKANSNEQKKLQLESKNNKYPLAIEIKRGVRPENYKKVEIWQRVTNEYLGQLILACLLQRPGTARSGKASIFTSEKNYNSIYKRKHDYNILYDLVRIAYVYDEFKKEYTRDRQNIDEIAVCSNGKFVVLAIVFYFYKRLFEIVDNASDSRLTEDNIHNTSLTLEYKEDDYENRLKEIFKFILMQLQTIYEKKKDSLKLTSYSNFFKTDLTYKDVILLELDKVLEVKYDRERIEVYMEIFKDNK
ncbi:MAG: AIPR family protein [Clostridia bacterium]|nr:AIPR family protein [Clostridia bacterium]